MTSIDTDKLIRDEARRLVGLVVPVIERVSSTHPRPDLHALELLDAVIEELGRERQRRMNTPPTKSQVVADAAARLGLATVEVPLQDTLPSNVIGLPRVGR